MGNHETIALTKECSAIIQENVLPKMKDQRSFTIPCSIGGVHKGQPLCDFRPSINHMSLSVYNRLGIGKLAPIMVTLQLANHSLVHPKGKLEDVLVKMDKFILPTDFILDYQADKNVPIILERPFLSTGRMQFDMDKEEIIIQVNDQKMKFNILKAMEYPDESNTCHAIEWKKVGLICLNSKSIR
ncbi:uncharacterized protein LOC120067577 [Benincasa hispida]|uniref:uncharacterized protein LOC120067577 n=1 Tax=Benincasa hispida TaxID=102211 RepID=UPI001901782C|nr:uncharacterized protein LOC120067577 [Benincasa hispida]